MKKEIQINQEKILKRKYFFPLLFTLICGLFSINANATTKTVGASGCDYTTISTAIGAYSSATDSLVLVLQSNYSAETNLTISQAATSLKPIVIRPAASLTLSGVTWTISGQYIYIDGRTLSNGNNSALSFSSSTVSFSTKNTNKIGYCNLNNFTVGTGVNLLGAITINGTLTLSSTLTTNGYTVTIADGATINRTASAATISTAPTYAGMFNLIYNAAMTMGLEVSSVYNTDNKINNITVVAGTLTTGGILYIRGNLDLQGSTAVLYTGADNYHINLYGDMPTGSGYINVGGKKSDLNLYGADGTTQNLRVSSIYNMIVNTNCTVKLGKDITPSLVASVVLNHGVLDFNGYKIDFSASTNTMTFTRKNESYCTNSGSGGGIIPNGKYYVQYQTSSPVSTGIEIPDIGTYPNGIYQLNLLSGGSDITLASNVRVAGSFILNNNLILGNGVKLTLVPVPSAATYNGYKINAANGIMDYAGGSSQPINDTYILNSTFGGLIINNTAEVALGNAITINGDLTINQLLKTSSKAITITGNTTGSGLFNAPSSITFAGTSEQTFASTISLTTVNVNAGSKLTNTGTITTTNLNILSDGTNGTGTLLNNGTLTVTTANVQQYLSGGRNWYVSSPVTNASSTAVLNSSTATTKPSSMVWYDETKGSTTPWTTATSTLTPTKGYVAVNGSPASTDGIITFTGTLNNGDISTATANPLTLSSTGVKDGFNLVGNPYPSYLDWSQVTKTNLSTTVWYRTFETGNGYKFYTYNSLDGNGYNQEGIAVPAIVTKWIPPMQAFWVRVTGAGGSIQFTNSARGHNDVSTNRLKAPSAKKSTLQLLRLQVSNGINEDETVVYFSPNATNGVDNNDSQKMFNNNAAIPEIYTVVDNEKLVINGMNSVDINTEIPLGFIPGSASAFSLKATEINNFETDTQILLKDNGTGEITNLTAGETYTFDNSVAPANRFSLIFKTPSATTGLNSANNTEDENHKICIFRNVNNQIVVNFKEAGANASVSVYNAMGQKLTTQQLIDVTTILPVEFTSGVYFVKVLNGNKTVTQKVILN